MKIQNILKKTKAIFKKILNIGGKKEAPPYPSDFCIIEYSGDALANNLLNDETKIIFRYTLNEYGNMKIKRYPYSEERVSSLQETFLVPVYDKTKEEPSFPIFARILPSEVQV